jgi:hypothetical protein
VPRFCRVLFATAFVIVAASHGVFALDLDRVLSKDTNIFLYSECKLNLAAPFGA